MDYAGQPVPGSPFFAKSYDSSKVVVRGICDGVVGRRCSFTGEYTFLLLSIKIRFSSGWGVFYLCQDGF